MVAKLCICSLDSPSPDSRFFPSVLSYFQSSGSWRRGNWAPSECIHWLVAKNGCRMGTEDRTHQVAGTAKNPNWVYNHSLYKWAEDWGLGVPKWRLICNLDFLCCTSFLLFSLSFSFIHLLLQQTFLEPLLHARHHPWEHSSELRSQPHGGQQDM